MRDTTLELQIQESIDQKKRIWIAKFIDPDATYDIYVLAELVENEEMTISKEEIQYETKSTEPPAQSTLDFSNQSETRVLTQLEELTAAIQVQVEQAASMAERLEVKLNDLFGGEAGEEEETKEELPEHSSMNKVRGAALRLEKNMRELNNQVMRFVDANL